MSRHIKKEKKLCQSASKMLKLARMLPFVLREFVDCFCDTYQCFLALLKIINIISEPHLHLLISSYFQLFKLAFASINIISKQHYLTHVPT